MRVLVISHNIFSKSASMGKTLAAYFDAWEKEELAQFYIHSEVPTVDICTNYFRFTDKDAIKSIFTRKGGRIYFQDDIKLEMQESFVFDQKTANIYQKGRKRTPIIYLVRNLLWKLSGWNNRRYRKWVDEFNPDVVFFASGDYAFLYDIALKTAKRKKIPLVVSCMDDYYFNNKNKNRILGKITHSMFMKQVRRTIDYSSCLMCICEKMSLDYEKLFQKKCYTLHTPTAISKPLNEKKTNAISYLGNLGNRRYENLIDIGRTLKALNIDNCPKFVDVYTTEPRQEILQYLTEENGIKLHKAVGYEEVKIIMGESLAVIHTESFKEEFKQAVAYSVSTKIADSLASGTCILAYGSKDVASIRYLENNAAAFVVNNYEDLQTKMVELITNAELRRQIETNAKRLAELNHNGQKNTKIIYEVMASLM